MPVARDILYLEDDHDLRNVVTEFLLDEGYDVTSVGTAAEALAALDRSRFLLLLTDYHLPDNHAGWLIREANARGLLGDTQIIVLTSEVAPGGVDGLLLLKKPVEGAVLLTEIARRVQTPALTTTPPTAATTAPTTTPTTTPPASVVRLTLYVSSSLDSIKAMRNLHRILKSFDEERIHLDVYDVSTGNEQCMASIEEDRVVVTPTLVRKEPRAKVWILGDLSKRGVVEEMIREGLRS